MAKKKAIRKSVKKLPINDIPQVQNAIYLDFTLIDVAWNTLQTKKLPSFLNDHIRFYLENKKSTA